MKNHLEHHADIHNNTLEYECFYCQYRIWNKRDFIEHLLNHFDELDYSCEICDEKFCNSANLTRHMEQHNYNQHKCSICGELSATYRIHMRHMQRKHLMLQDYGTYQTVIRPEEDTVKPLDWKYYRRLKRNERKYHRKNGSLNRNGRYVNP